MIHKLEPTNSLAMRIYEYLKRYPDKLLNKKKLYKKLTDQGYFYPVIVEAIDELQTVVDYVEGYNSRKEWSIGVVSVSESYKQVLIDDLEWFESI